MAANASKGPKPWTLTENESFSSYERWQSNIEYCLGKEEEFKRFLKTPKPDNKDLSWEKLDSDNPLRGYLMMMAME